MENIIITREFTSDDRNPNVNGNQRVLHVTSNGDKVRMIVSGVQGSGLNTRIVTLSDVTIDRATWDEHEAIILASLGA